MAGVLLEGLSSPVINHPGTVMLTGRMCNAKRLGAVPGVITPRMALISKSDIYSGEALAILEQKQIGFPILTRAPNFHGGNHFVRVEDPTIWGVSVADLPSKDLLVMECLDARSDDGLFRKYRVMSINGVLYPLHLAISTQWKVHYFSSDMAQHEEYRNEEAVFLKDFSSFLDSESMATLQRLSQVLGLDYGGIDFGLDNDGNILLFEANATMAIVPPASDHKWDYKRDAIEIALAATNEMLIASSR